MVTRILSSIMSVIVLLLSLLGIRTTRDTGSFDNKQWMLGISDSQYISEITIPGTHDSCAHYEPVYGMIKCQEYTLKDQLDMGVRFLDIRGTLIGDQMVMMHNVIPQSMCFDDVLEICYEFLEEYPSETIIMSIKQESGDNREEFISYVEKTVADDIDMWYIENEIPMLSQVRGKIILLNRYEKQSTDFGISTYYWVSNEAFTVDNGDFSLHIQDYYCVEGTLEEKWSLVEAHYEESRVCADEDSFYINFTSAYIGDVPNILTVSNYVNPLLVEYLEDSPTGCYGVTVMDFADEELCNLLVGKNFSR